MTRRFSNLLSQSLIVLVAGLLAPSLFAAPLKLTMSGPFMQQDPDPATGCCETYENSGGTLPFAEPVSGTEFIVSATLDPSQPDVVFPGFHNRYELFSPYFQVGSQVFTGRTGSLSIFNDLPPGTLPPSFPFYQQFLDAWILSLILDSGESLSVLMLEPSLQPTVAALQSAEFSIPNPSLFTSSFFLYGSLAGDHALAGVNSVVVSAVPIPAAAWLFASALLGVIGRKRSAN